MSFEDMSVQRMGGIRLVDSIYTGLSPRIYPFSGVSRSPRSSSLTTRISFNGVQHENSDYARKRTI